MLNKHPFPFVLSPRHLQAALLMLLAFVITNINQQWVGNATIYSAEALRAELKRLSGRSKYHSVAVVGRDVLAPAGQDHDDPPKRQQPGHQEHVPHARARLPPPQEEGAHAEITRDASHVSGIGRPRTGIDATGSIWSRVWVRSWTPCGSGPG